MPSDFIGIETKGLDEVIKALRLLPPAAKKQVQEDVSTYLLGELQKEPPYKKVTRKAAYGQTFSSDKQRRGYFARLKSGEISVPYQRTGRFSAGWTIQRGESYKLTNATPGGQYVMGNNQARLLGMIGWKKIDAWMKDKIGNVGAIMKAAVVITIKKLGLS